MCVWPQRFLLAVEASKGIPMFAKHATLNLKNVEDATLTFALWSCFEVIYLRADRDLGAVIP